MNILYIAYIARVLEISNMLRNISIERFYENFKESREICFCSYFAKQFILTEYPDHVLQNDI